MMPRSTPLKRGPKEIEYKESPELIKLAEDAIIEYPDMKVESSILDEIVFLESKGRARWVGCYFPIKSPHSILTDKKALIAVMVDVVKKLSKNEPYEILCKKVLIHEMMHHTLGHHDRQDFKLCLEKWGIDWVGGEPGEKGRIA